MKMRQRLAAVLAATMVLTAVPAVTMAKSDNSLTKGITKGKKDDKVTTAALRIEMKDAVTTTTTFFVNLNNAKWLSNFQDTTGGTEVVAKKNNDSEVQVTITPAGASFKQDFDITLYVELKGGDATVAIDGNGSEISDMSSVVFASTSEDKAGVTFGDSKNVYLQGAIADITILEPFKGVIDPAKKITVEIDNPDYEFILPTQSDNFTFTKGYAGSGISAPAYVVNSNGKTDTSAFTFTLNDSTKNLTAPGRIEIKGVQIKAKDRKPVVGDDIYVTVKGDNIVEARAKVAVSTAIGSTLQMKDKKVVDVVAGTKKDITFKLVENVEDSILDGRLIAFTLDNGYFAKEQASKTSLGTLQTTIEGKIKVKDSVEKVENFAWIFDNEKDDKKVIGFEFNVKSGELKTNRVDEITVEDVTVYMPLNKSGDVKITAEGRALGEELSTVAINLKAPIEVASEAKTVKVGLKGQKEGGKLTITETDKGMLKQGEYLRVKIDDKAEGFKISGKPEIKVLSGDIVLDTNDFDKDDGHFYIKIKRASKEASVIEITNIPLDVDRTVPQGNYDLKVYGSALQKDHTYGDFKVADFVKVGTPNTEDITANGLRKGTSSFVIGSDKFVVNGTEVTMDAAAYLDKAGRTMVPLRFVANALGVEDTNIYYAGKTATVVAGTKTISVTLGDKVAKLNGVAVRNMDVAPTMINDRVYVPVGEIAALLSVDAAWDGATQTATFTVK